MVLVSVNISPFPSLLSATVFNNNLVFSNLLLPSSCPWFLCRLTVFCLKSLLNLAKYSRAVAAVHYLRHQEFLSLVKTRIKKLNEKEVVCCSVMKKERDCAPGCMGISWLHGGRGTVGAMIPITLKELWQFTERQIFMSHYMFSSLQ